MERAANGPLLFKLSTGAAHKLSISRGACGTAYHAMNEVDRMLNQPSGRESVYAAKQRFKTRAFAHILTCDTCGLEDLLKTSNPVGHLDFKYRTPLDMSHIGSETLREFLAAADGLTPLELCEHVRHMRAKKRKCNVGSSEVDQMVALLTAAVLIAFT